MNTKTLPVFFVLIAMNVASAWADNKLSDNDTGDWHHAAPGVMHHITVADLPKPYNTTSTGNAPIVIKKPKNASLSVLPGFTVKLFAKDLQNPRTIKVAPNGDIFVAETRMNRIRILRAVDGADTPSVNQIFAEGLDRPFGIAFYPLGNNPQWIYIANNNSVVRYPYHSGDLHAQGAPQIIVPTLCDGCSSGHTTRNIAFSLDGKRLFIQVGSSSNAAEGMSHKSLEEIKAWESVYGRGAAWGKETNRAQILVTDPEGKIPLRAFATGIRNGAGIAVDPSTGKLWASTNERDGLGDNLVPDYVTHVKEGGFYGWPWYYMGDNVDPLFIGERPDLAHDVIDPDVLFQSHSAPLDMVFYTTKSGSAVFPLEYQGDIFVAMHGSWNRTHRTGYKVVRVHLNHGVADGTYEDFLTGFVVDNERVWGRPVGVAVAHDGALLITEDGNDTIWRVAYRAT